MSDYLKKRLAFIEAGRPLPEKKKYTIPKVSKKRAEKIAKEKEERGDNDTELVKFYKAAMRGMTGACQCCFAKTETKDYSAAIFSIAHILEKRDSMFPSVKTHPQNWLELCPDCHTNYDKMNWEEREKSGIWFIVWQKLLMVYDSIDKSELHHLPTDLRERIERANNVFDK